jgi:hypothetical protein
MVTAMLVGQLANIFYCLVVWGGTAPIPGHTLVIPPFTWIVNGVLVMAAIRRSQRIRDRSAAHVGSNVTIRKRSTAFGGGMKLALGNVHKSFSQSRSSSENKWTGSWIAAEKNLGAKDEMRVITRSWKSNSSGTHAQDTTAAAAQVIQRAYGQKILIRVMQYRRRKSMRSLLTCFTAQLAAFVVYYLCLLIIIAYPSVFTGLPGGTETAGLLLPLIETLGGAFVKWVLRDLNSKY